MTSRPDHETQAVPATGDADASAVVQFRAQYRRLLWEVTENGRVFGHYPAEQLALAAAIAAAKAVVARGGKADVVLVDESGANIQRTSRFRPPQFGTPAFTTPRYETPAFTTPPFSTPAFTTPTFSMPPSVPEPGLPETKTGEPATPVDPRLR